MTGHFAYDFEELPLICGMATCVGLFGWRCVRRRVQDQSFFSARLVLALLVVVPAALYALHTLDRIPPNFYDYNWDNTWNRIKEARYPLQLGLGVCGGMFVIHTVLWILPKLKRSSAKATPISHEYSRSH